MDYIDAPQRDSELRLLQSAFLAAKRYGTTGKPEFSKDLRLQM
jgi:hypothetical protein